MELAHGVGGGGDLPIPASLAIAGGTAALTLSFAVLILAWRTPRYESVRDGARGRSGAARSAGSGRPLAGLASVVDSTAWKAVWRAVGLMLFGFTGVCLLFGPDDASVNPVAPMVYVLLWVGLIPASLLFGKAVKALSPVRTIHLGIAAVLRRDPDAGFRELPARLGLWPAAFGLLAFTWLELVVPDSTALLPIGLWFGGYLVVMLAGGVVFGARWFERADPFEVYSTLLAHLSPWGRRRDGTIELVSPLRHLARIEPRPGLVAVVGVLLGSTAFDSVRDSTTWIRFRQENADGIVVLETVALTVFCAVVALLFWAATAFWTPVKGVDRRELPDRLAHSVVPIVLGYMVAHYLTLFVETGQRTLIQMSDPFGDGANLLGITGYQVDLVLSSHPGFLATVKVLAIVLGHVVGIVAAHDRSLALLPPRLHTTGQMPLLGLMVLFTFSGLYLLFGI